MDFRSARVRVRLTQANLAQYLGVTQSTISRFEGGTLALSPDQRLKLIELILERQKKQDG